MREQFDTPVDSTHNGASDGRDSVVPEDAGERIPIPIRSPEPEDGDHRDGPSDETPRPAPGLGLGLPGAAAIPDVMGEGADDRPHSVPVDARSEEESVEAFVSRIRPRSIRMQLRFLRTLLFAFWLFGRLIFWQVYVFRFFPRWVINRNTRRWQKYAREFRGFAIEMGGVMIKAGQFASTRADALPEEVIAELVSLQDEVPSVAYRKILEVIQRELGPVEDRFCRIWEEPVAAASLGQVHRAQLHTGEKVVVKVQRPGIRDLVYTDLSALFIVARVAMRFNFIRRRADVIDLSEEFGRVLLEEISYYKEARNAARFKQMFADNDGVYIPTVHTRHSTDYVLTLEDVTTLKINDYEGLAAAGIDRKAVAKRLMDTYMQQIFRDRFFHADPHPGNLFVHPLPADGPGQHTDSGGRPFRLIFVDFGMTGTLTREITQGLINTLTAVITRDAARLVESYQQLGFILPGADTQRIEEATRLVFDQVWGMSMNEMTSMDFETVSNIGREFNDLLYDMPFRVPQDFVYLGRTVGILTGMCTALDPTYNPWQEIQHYMQEFMLEDDEQILLRELQKTFVEPLLTALSQGPQGVIPLIRSWLERLRSGSEAERILRQIASGEVAVTSRPSPQYRRQLERLEVQSRKSTLAFIFGSFLVTATLFYTNGDTTLAAVGYGAAAVTMISLWLTRP